MATKTIKPTKFKNRMYVDIYRFARDGMSDNQIAGALGVAYLTFRDWRRRDPDVEYALSEGRNKGPEYTFGDYIYDHLDPDIREVWDRINAVDQNEPNAVTIVESLLASQGVKARQRLFLHALTNSLFNVSKSLKKVGLSKNMFDHWCQRDPDFAEMVREIAWHKDNFMESSLLGRVAAGDTSAIIHVARTKLRHRGYNDKIEVEHTGTVKHEHTVSVADLDLDLNTRKAILAALRAHQANNDAIPVTALPVTL